MARETEYGNHENTYSQDAYGQDIDDQDVYGQETNTDPDALSTDTALPWSPTDFVASSVPPANSMTFASQQSVDPTTVSTWPTEPAGSFQQSGAPGATPYNPGIWSASATAQPYVQEPDFNNQVGSASYTMRAQPPAPSDAVNFGSMPKAGKTHTGLVVGVILGCLALVAVVLIGAHAFTGWIGNQLDFGGKPSDIDSLFGDSDNPHGFDGDGSTGMDDWMLGEWLKEHGLDIDDFGSLSSDHKDDPSADDGELHDARTENVNYEIVEEFYMHSDSSEYVDAYGMDLQLDFFVDYPALKGNLEHKDKINEAIRTAAMGFVTKAYLDPDPAFVEIVKKSSATGPTTDEEGMEYSGDQEYVPVIFASEDYAITYNSDKLMSIVFSHHYWIGDKSFLEAEEVNINLETGESYTFDDVLQITEPAARHWAKNIVEHIDPYDVVGELLPSSATEKQAEDLIVDCVVGKGEGVYVLRGFFVDGNGKVNLNVSWHLDTGVAQGWWDVTLTNDELEEMKKDSSFWELL